MTEQPLALFEHAREAVAAAANVDEVMSLRTRGEQAKAYARIAKDKGMLADATEIIARATRKLGFMLHRAKEEGQMSVGGRPAENSNLGEETGADGEPVFDRTTFTLSEIGVSKKLSSQAQQLAQLDEDDFEAEIAAKREKIIAAEAAVVGPAKMKVVKAAKPDQTNPLEARRFHQFAFSMLALSVSSDRVGSEAIQFLAQECGIAVLDGDIVDFSPEAMEAFGGLATAALKALDEGFVDQPETAKAGEDRVTAAAAGESPATPSVDGSDAQQHGGDDEVARAISQTTDTHDAADKGGQRADADTGFGSAVEPGAPEDYGDSFVFADELYVAAEAVVIATSDASSEALQQHFNINEDSALGVLFMLACNGITSRDGAKVIAVNPFGGPLPIPSADRIIRFCYQRGTGVATIAAAIGRPGDKGKAYVRNRARVMKISSRERQREMASAFATAQNAARREGRK